MPSEKKDKKWGKIFMGPAPANEATLESLDAMQAASRREQMQQRAMLSFEENVKARAVERAKLILGQAYEEREKILAEAEREAAAIRAQAKNELNRAKESREEAARLSDNAKDIELQTRAKFSTAHEDGFNAGVASASEELRSFRAAMGDSIVAVLTAISGQCMAIFESWRAELVETTRVCVEKITAYTLTADRRAVLEALLMEAMRQLDRKRNLHLRVSLQDEEAVADIIAAAKERVPDLEAWTVRGDAQMEPGGLAVESDYGAVDSRIEVRRAMVENILSNLTLPQSQVDEKALYEVAEALQRTSEAIAPLAHPDGIPAAGPEAEAESEPENENPPAQSPPEPASAPEEPEASPRSAPAEAAPAAQTLIKEADSLVAPQAEAPSAAARAEAPSGEAGQKNKPAQKDKPAPEARPAAAVEPKAAARETDLSSDPALAALEQELLPLPEVEETGYSESMNKILAGGGFLPPLEKEAGK